MSGYLNFLNYSPRNNYTLFRKQTVNFTVWTKHLWSFWILYSCSCAQEINYQYYSVLQPFWPTGTGCARGFLGCFDAAWAMRGWGLGKEPLDILAERDSIYRLLAQTTPENISKNFEEFGINPVTRYPNLNKSCVSQNRVKHLFDNKNGPIDQPDGSEPMDISKELSAVEGGGEKQSRKSSYFMYLGFNCDT